MLHQTAAQDIQWGPVSEQVKWAMKASSLTLGGNDEL